MTHPNPDLFDLPHRLAAKADPALVADDERHLAAVAACLERTVADLAARLDATRRAPARAGQQALDRDQEVHRLTARLHTLRRHGVDLCLGRMVPADGGEPVYVGRLGLTDADGRQLLVDWRSPAAGPFFGATLADPMGLATRRRYRWTGGLITDYWDELFLADAADGEAGPLATASLDDQSAFVASLGGARSAQMRDVLGTLAADQDAVIRAGARGALVVDGGPGTGKTVVALHRAAYLLYADPQVEARRGGVLVVGPHQPYLDYVADVLPSLGEEGVQLATLRDLVPEGGRAGAEEDPEVARLKGSADLVRGIETAVRFYEEPPTRGRTVSTPWADVRLTAGDWAEAFAAPEPGTPHNDARDEVWDALVDILVDKHDDDAPPEQVRRAVEQDAELRAALGEAWPLLDAADVVGDLWSVPAYLRLCAPWLSPEEVRRLQRAEPQAWTTSDLPLLDATRQRLGDPAASRRRRRERAEGEAAAARMDDVVADLVAADDSELQVMSMLRGDDLRGALDGAATTPRSDVDRLAGPFAHLVVDEAQELTDAEWQVLLLRCPSRSLTIVGDRAQARHGFTDTWPERLARAGIEGARVAGLGINYRTPSEVMAEAAPVIRAAIPDANVPRSVRSSGLPVVRGRVTELDDVLDRWLAEHDGVACVIGVEPDRERRVSRGPDRERVRWLDPVTAKGLEFDLVVLVDPGGFAAGESTVAAAVDRYVAMSRATQQLVVLEP
ncbi:RNA polymerase recycling motor ATPase HelR [Luteimicrobium sp. DT211]|uniref:RNA polymerase recycling motor ATPase HelR n=1 Tax=Luteimicrobium sp. DT211 TaxID=3393412 RepID=UPI003CE7FBD4